MSLFRELGEEWKIYGYFMKDSSMGHKTNSSMSALEEVLANSL
jgi:hypothetical protein